MIRSQILLATIIAMLLGMLPACQKSKCTASWKPAEYPPESTWRHELPEEAKPLMPRFQQALHESEWETALSCCSERVRTAADKYESPEAFFQAVVPIKDVVETQEYRFTQLKGRPTLFCFNYPWRFHIPGLDGEYRRHWESKVYKTDAGWVIDFWLMPLESRIERIKADIAWRQTEEFQAWKRECRRRQKALKVKVKALRTRLTPMSETFVLGQPMLFRLEVDNRGEDELAYGRYVPLTFVDPMTITDESGQTASYMGPAAPQRVYEGDTPIKPGRSVILLDGFDITKHYDITRPGRYKVQFTGGMSVGEAQYGAFGGSREFPSNIVEIDITR